MDREGKQGRRALLLSAATEPRVLSAGEGGREEPGRALIGQRRAE